MSSGRLFQSFGPTEPNERSPTVTRRDGRTSSIFYFIALIVSRSDISAGNSLPVPQYSVVPFFYTDV